MKTTAQKIKSLFQEMENAEVVAERAEELYSNTPDERHEKMFDIAYKKSFESTEKLVAELCLIGYDAKTWRRVIATRRADVRDLCYRLQK